MSESQMERNVVTARVPSTEVYRKYSSTRKRVIYSLVFHLRFILKWVLTLLITDTDFKAICYFYSLLWFLIVADICGD